jgi:hypothetical protein
MKIKIVYDDFTEVTVNSTEEAKNNILDCHANGVTVEQIYEVDENGEQINGISYSVSWTVEIEKQEDNL